MLTPAASRMYPPQYDSDDAVNKLLGLDGRDCSLLSQDQSHAWIFYLTTPAELQSSGFRLNKTNLNLP